MEDEDGDIFFIAKTIYCRTALHSVGELMHYTGIETYLPVSPLVAPTTVKRSFLSPADLRAFRLARKNSNRFPRSCSATSLNANVGPWKSSRTKSLSLSFFKGVISGWRKVLYDFSTNLRRSDFVISFSEMYNDKISTDKSMNEWDFQFVCQFSGRYGMYSGMYRPPFGAKPVKTVCVWTLDHCFQSRSDEYEPPQRKVFQSLHGSTGTS